MTRRDFPFCWAHWSIVPVMLVIVLVMVAGYCHGAEKKSVAPPPAVCFDQDTASKIVVELETGRIEKKELETTRSMLDSYATTITKYEAVIKEYETRLSSTDGTVEGLQKLMEVQQASYEKALKEARPSFWEWLGVGTAGAAVGFLIGLLVL